MNPRLLFLDIDGCLNTHDQWPNKYCRIHYDKVQILNMILDAVPDCQIVLSSAWRYTIQTVRAVETLLAVHGCECVQRIHGLTESDELTHGGTLPSFGDCEAWRELGLRLRSNQIRKYLAEHQSRFWCAIDDLPLDLANLVKCESDQGLGIEQANQAITFLRG